MASSARWHRIPALVTAAVLGACAAKAGSLGEDASWKNYYNPSGHYCVDYPARWRSGEAFEGSGFYVKPRFGPAFKTAGEIDVSVLPIREGASLREESQLHLDSLKRFQLAENVRVVDQHAAEIIGNPGLFTKSSFFDSQTQSTMVDESVLAIHDGMLYRIQLTGRADQFARLEKVFQHLVSTLQFDCPAHPLPRDFAANDSGRQRAGRTNGPPVLAPHRLVN